MSQENSRQQEPNNYFFIYRGERFYPPYYSGLQQIKYFDPFTKKYKGGFGYHNLLIDGETGEMRQIDGYLEEVCYLCNMNPDDIIIELSWINLNKIILEGKY